MIFKPFLQIALILCAITVSFKLHAQNRPQPEIATGLQKTEVAKGQSFMAVTANPHATKAAYDILKKGGSAADAAIAAQLVLGLVEPQSSGLGGGAFALVYDAKTKKLRSYDARETAPNLAGPFLFFENGKPLAFKKAVIGGRAVGVPGLPMLLSDMHERHGKLTWMELFDAAIALSQNGFEVSPRLATMIANDAENLAKHKPTAAYFLPDGKPIAAGEMLKNPQYFETLKDMNFANTRTFYHGQVANAIIDTVQNYEDNPGLLSRNDFTSYEVKERKPVCAPYRAYKVCSMGQPSSGGLTLLQILGMLEHFDLSQQNEDTWHIIAQASALAFADRGIYMADGDFVATPDIALINPNYLKERAALIDPLKPLQNIKAGSPKDWNADKMHEGESFTQPGTTHISTMDKDGNIVSMTSSIEGAFGSHLMSNGFLLNNQLTDFSFDPLSKCKTQSAQPTIGKERDIDVTTGSFRVFIEPDACARDDAFVANMVGPGKRPRSSMAPTIVFDNTGAPVLVIGSAGGSRIINHVLQRIISVIDWGMPIAEAVKASHILARDETIEIEGQKLEQELMAKGNTVIQKEITSGLTAIAIQDNLITGIADPRREGIALGE
ncbi:MAG: gamma-glutamyltransferase [Bdellovibrionales bacterium]